MQEREIGAGRCEAAGAARGDLHRPRGSEGALRARDLCQALDTGFEPNRIEGTRSKLKRLVKRGILEEPTPGEFRLRRP
jgi:hypothetical protein